MSTIFGNFFTSKNDNSSQQKSQSTASKTQSNSILGEVKSLAAATEKGIGAMTSSNRPVSAKTSPMISESDSSSSSSSGFYSYLSFRNIVILFVVLLFLGYNILSAAGSTAEDIRYGLQPILSSIANVFGLTLGSFIKTTSDESTKGVVTIAETTNKAVDDVVDETQKVLGGTPVEKDDESEDEEEEDESGEKALDKAIDLAPQKKSVVEADEAGSKTQGKTGKAGWCYIGEDRGFRSCAKVGRQQECESGEYFSRKELCENPDLRK